VSWHVPNKEEIQFAIELLDDIVDPTLIKLEALLEDNVTRDAAWRNDYCRFLLFVQEAFSGIAGIAKEEATQEERDIYYSSTDLPYATTILLPNPIPHYPTGIASRR
jgi:proteasome activator subunit 4